MLKKISIYFMIAIELLKFFDHYVYHYILK